MQTRIGSRLLDRALDHVIDHAHRLAKSTMRHHYVETIGVEHRMEISLQWPRAGVSYVDRRFTQWTVSLSSWIVRTFVGRHQHLHQEKLGVVVVLKTIEEQAATESRLVLLRNKRCTLAETASFVSLCSQAVSKLLAGALVLALFRRRCCILLRR